jgi:alpha-L-fucosidase
MMNYVRIMLATVLFFNLAACQEQEESAGVAQEDTPVANLAPSSEKEMQERIAAAKQKVGWADPEIGKGALDEKEAARYAGMKHLFKRPHFNKPTDEYADQWAKLASYELPEWLLDAKFGVYTHWGPSTVPEYTGAGNYIANMYNPKGKEGIYEHHVKNYGGIEKTGYTDLIDMFTAPDYDPQQYVDLMLEAGAKFGGLGLVHHDGYLMWDSEVSRWNSMDTGPHRDLFGEFVEQARKTDLKVLGSFHHARSYNYTHKNIDKSLLTEEQIAKADVFQEEYVDFFFPEDKYPAAQFAQDWHDKIVEISDKYQPDFIWFDGIQMQREHSPEPIALSALSHYYETSYARGQEVSVCSKLPAGDVVTQTAWFNYPEGVGLRCYENGRDMPADNGGYWLWDRAIAYPWGYIKNKKYSEDANYHVDSLVDIVARGGIFLLSLTPRASGAISPEEVVIMKGIGAWLKINGEAIYGTRRWHIPGEDHNDVTAWQYNDKRKRITWKYKDVGPAQIRFTQAKDGTLYATVLGRPEDGQVSIRNLREGSEYRPEAIQAVSLLGFDGEISFERTDEALVINFPAEAAESYAYAFRIE